MVAKVSQLGGGKNRRDGELGLFHAVTANLEKLNKIGLGLSERDYKRLLACQESVRLLLTPNRVHPTVVAARRVIQESLDGFGSVYAELERVSTLEDLALMLHSCFELPDGVEDPVILFGRVLEIMYRALESVSTVVENAFTSGNWDSADMPVDKRRLMSWSSEENAGVNIVSPQDVNAERKGLDSNGDLLVARVQQLAVGFEGTSSEKIVLGGIQLGSSSKEHDASPSKKENAVVDLLTNTTESDRYDFPRPKVLWRFAVELAVRKGWGVIGANKKLEPVTPCPMTVAEAIRSLDVEELAVFFITFPDMFRSWRASAYTKYQAVVERYRQQVKNFYERKDVCRWMSLPPAILRVVIWLSAGVLMVVLGLRPLRWRRSLRRKRKKLLR